MWDLLRENWWLTFVLLAYLASAAGNVFQRAVQKASQQQRSDERRRHRVESSDAQHSVRPVRTQATENPEPDIAAEIRRIMGIELEPRAAPRREPAPEPISEAVEVPYVDPHNHGGDLAERLAAADAEREARFKSSIDDRAKSLGAAIRDRYAAQSADSLADDAPRGKRRPRRIVRFDRSRIIDAVVAREVLGPPRAMRPFGEDSF
ncbi:MAG: hypothetical protein KDB80_08150 [Planctomycetes bacterium]|nr:hypothetical protein [Planctomycetota bacterium]